jgi:hypothetical protein
MLYCLSDHTSQLFCLPNRCLDAEEMMSALQELGMLEGMRPKQLGEQQDTDTPHTAPGC